MKANHEISEELAYWLWSEGHFQKDQLKTIDGKEVKIIYPGIRNLDAGPDFKDAGIYLDGKIVKGDIEVHKHPSDWAAHGHHRDSGYNQVILHVVLENPAENEVAFREDGLEVPSLVLSDVLNQPLAALQEKFRASRNLPATHQKSCYLNTCEEEFILTVIEYHGASRLELKAQRFKEQRGHHSWEQILYRGFMEALGYSKNQLPFRKLADRLPVEFIFRELRSVAKDPALVKAQGLLFGTAGLLPSQIRKAQAMVEKATVDFCLHLQAIWLDFWHRLGIEPMRVEEWQFFRLRPQNFPTRRLAGICFLLVQFSSEGILKNFLRIFQSLPEDLDRLIEEMERLLTVEAFDYWQQHFRLEEPEPKPLARSYSTLIGKDRAREIVVNVVLPCFLQYAEETEDGQLQALVREVYQRYPRTADNSITRTLSRQLLGEGRRSQSLINTAQKQQGLIHIFKTFCNERKCNQCVSIML